MPFFNTPVQFLQEAVESVFTQSYENWELLLVDDGSKAESTTLAKDFAARNPERVSYLEHPGHENRGLSASRTLGIAEAKGAYIAFLDADDVWLPEKLEQQVTLVGTHPQVSMIYGNTQYWYSWTRDPKDHGRDFMPRLGVPAGTVVQPPTLLSLFLGAEAAVPCPSSILVRCEVFDDIGGFEDAFGIFDTQQLNMYEDQVFYAKVCLAAPVFVMDACWHRYRQHPSSICAVAESTGRGRAARLTYLRWLAQYLSQKQCVDQDLWRALRRELWVARHPFLGRPLKRARRLIWRCIKYAARVACTSC